MKNVSPEDAGFSLCASFVATALCATTWARALFGLSRRSIRSLLGDFALVSLFSPAAPASAVDS
ncbi:hypothetical protein SS05631_a47630 (plasmid) [Sinorhizobium sp. CCBAU 05631]|nr:hypothetical protein SS05631_a47630 [Sinorhizobium sp. CCBAU 05631]